MLAHSKLLLALTSVAAFNLPLTAASPAQPPLPPNNDASMEKRESYLPNFCRVLGYPGRTCSNNTNGDATLVLDSAAIQFKQDVCLDINTPAQSHRIHFYGPVPPQFSYLIYSRPCNETVNPSDVKTWDYWDNDLKDTTCYASAPGDPEIRSLCYGVKCRSAGAAGRLKSQLLISRTGNIAPTGVDLGPRVGEHNDADIPLGDVRPTDERWGTTET